ncbi:MAG: site-specific integrase [Microbacterium sp.]
MTVPTSEEVRRALGAAPEEFRAFVALAAFAGLRLGEAAGVQVGDVNFLRRTLDVRRQVQGATKKTVKITPPKYNSFRLVPIPTDLAELLAAHVETIGTQGDEAWLFFRGSDRLNRNSAGEYWRGIREATALPDEYTLHDLRHFYASALIASGCDVVTVQRALGHKTPSITLNTYAHLWPTAEDRTRSAATDLMREVLGDSADLVRTERQ